MAALDPEDIQNRMRLAEIYYNQGLQDEALKKELSDILQLQLGDTQKAVYFKNDLSNERIMPGPQQEPIAAQESIYNYVKELHGNPGK